MKKGKLPKNAPVFDVDDFDIHEGKKLSAVLQDHERLILEEAMKFARERGVCVTSYCYDGFQVLREGWEPSMIDRINKRVYGSLGLWKQNRNGGNQLPLFCKYCKFIVKDFQEHLNMDNLLPLSGTLKIENDKDATGKILAIYPHLKCCDGTLYVFDHKRGMWKPDDKFLTFKHILMSHRRRRPRGRFA